MIAAGFQFYAYATFTTPHLLQLEARVKGFVDKLQGVHELLPLWTTPLKIQNFAVTSSRLDKRRSESLNTQFTVFEAWDAELRRRFSSDVLCLRPDEIR